MTRTFAIIAALLVASAVYLGACWLWPYAPCWSCSGAGRKRSPSGRAWRWCRWCQGSGYRIRVGRKLWSWFTGTSSDARR